MGQMTLQPRNSGELTPHVWTLTSGSGDGELGKYCLSFIQFMNCSEVLSCSLSREVSCILGLCSSSQSSAWAVKYHIALLPVFSVSCPLSHSLFLWFAPLSKVSALNSCLEFCFLRSSGKGKHNKNKRLISLFQCESLWTLPRNVSLSVRPSNGTFTLYLWISKFDLIL